MPPAAPSLRIRRVIVDGALALDLSFEDRVNVLTTPGNDPRHSNKAGKTGLVELIQYGLGRQVRSRAAFHFFTIQSEIATLWLEITCNGQSFTIRRSLQQHSAGVSVFPRVFDAALRGSAGETMDLSTLSEFLLFHLGIPLVEVSQQDGRMIPLTFPTLMRAFVLHQDDSFGAILDKVESDGKRGDILGLLSGARPRAVYDLEVTKGATVTRASSLAQAYEAIRDFLAKQGLTSVEGARERVQIAERALSDAVQIRQAAQATLRDRQSAPNENGPPTVGHTDTLRRQLLGIHARRAERERDVLGYSQEAARARQLIASLEVDEAKARRLHVSEVILSTFEFDVCPRCTQEVTPDMRAREVRHRCSLCSRPLILTSDVVPRTAPAIGDIVQQLEEARQMRVEAEADASESARALDALRQEEQELASALDAETAAYISPAVDSLLALSQQVSLREAELADAMRLLRQAEGLRDLSDAMVVAQRAANEADAALLTAQSEATRRLRDLEATYLTVLKDLEFPDVSGVEIDPITLMPKLDGALYVHRGAALRGLAVVGYHLALLRLSLSRRTLFPRLLVMDSPAVGDLNPANHDRLLRYIAEIQEGAWSEEGRALPPWQLILTTRRMVTELQPYVRMRIKAAPGHMLLRPRAIDTLTLESRAQGREDV